MNFLNLQHCRLQHIKNLYQKYNVEVSVLRLDEIHNEISGNKWFKLKEYLKEAQEMQKKYIITFGGAFSNHILATAAACKGLQLKSIGIIRGEEPKQYSNTLQQAVELNMQLFFTSRESYKQKIIPDEVFEIAELKDCYIINEGGYGKKGVEGAKDILKDISADNYNYILCAVGTGTTLAGLVQVSSSKQKIIGISTMKNNVALQDEINAILPEEQQNNFQLLNQFHFNGYAKYTAELISFMNDWFTQTAIRSDFVYTSKLFFAADHLIKHNFFKEESKILIIHSGGLQGNRSLQNGTLIF